MGVTAAESGRSSRCEAGIGGFASSSLYVNVALLAQDLRYFANEDLYGKDIRVSTCLRGIRRMLPMGIRTKSNILKKNRT